MSNTPTTDMIKGYQKDLREATELLDILFDTLGNISPVSAGEFLGPKNYKRLVKFMFRHGDDDWLWHTDGMSDEWLNKLPDDIKSRICKKFNCETWEEFIGDWEEE